nr:MAG TPA: hypothetical protein [Caudoviricetes sp.]
MNRKSVILTTMCALALTTSAYASNIEQGSGNTITNSPDHIVIGDKLKMKNSKWGIMIGRESEMEFSEIGTSIGVYNRVKGFDSVALGNHCEADGITGPDHNWTAVAVGSGAVAKGSESVAMGVFARAEGQSAIAYGDYARAKGYNAIAIGHWAISDSNSGIAIGNNTEAYGADSVALGNSAHTYGKWSIAINTWTVKGDHSVGIGGQVFSERGTAIGGWSSVNVDDGVALGYDSKADTAKGVLGWDPAIMGFNETHRGWGYWESTAGAVSVGNRQYKRQITNVAAGTNSDDAVNVAQLKSLAEVVHGNNIVDGSINDDGTITLKKKDGSKVNLKGKMKDNSVQPGEYDISVDNKVTLEVKDNYSGTKLGDVIIKDVAKASDLKKEQDARKAADLNITNTIGATDPTNLSSQYSSTTYIKGSTSLVEADQKLDAAIKQNKDSITNINNDIHNIHQDIHDVRNSITNINGRMGKLDRRINKATANTAALAALHPLDFDPDSKFDVAVGYGHYKSANATAIGAFYRPNEDSLVSVGASFGGGENVINAGLSFKIGGGNHMNGSKIAMAKEIKDLKAEVDNLRSVIKELISGRPIDTSKIKIFPDIPKNHWAYEYIATLAGNDIIKGYPDGEFKGDRVMTRYEFGAIIYRALQMGYEVPDRMLEEFEPEVERFRIDIISQSKDGNHIIERVRVN